jgi:UDP-N-acetylglucosamine transferase subunit ALG13
MADGTGDALPPLVLVTVGTDHHRFDRLMQWVERWIAFGGGESVRCVVQHGSSTPPAGAECHRLLPNARLNLLMESAAAVVAHGGPGTIMSARAAGVVPIVVPRSPQHLEHVDDHQVLFSRRLAAEGRIVVAEDEADLGVLLDRALGGDAFFRCEPGDDGVAATVDRFGRLVEHAVTLPRRRWTLSRPWREVPGYLTEPA